MREFCNRRGLAALVASGGAGILDWVLCDFALLATLLGEDLEARELAAVKAVGWQKGVGGELLALPQDEEDFPLLPNPHVLDNFKLA